MKKFKIIPSLFIAIACFVMLGVGIYAAGTRATLGMGGMVTVSARGYFVEITAYLDEGGVKKPISTPAKVGIEGNGTININQRSLIFNRDNQYANADDVPPIRIAFGIKNNSGTSLGAYFLKDGFDPNLDATEDAIATEKYLGGTLAGTDIPVDDAVRATLSTYTEILPNKTETFIYCDLELNALDNSDFNVELNLSINIEKFNIDLVPTTIEVHSPSNVAMHLTSYRQDGTVLGTSSKNILAGESSKMPFTPTALSEGDDLIVKLEVENMDPNKELGAYFYQPPEEEEEIEIPEQATLYDVLVLQEVFDEEGEPLFHVWAQSYSHINKAQASASDKTDEATFYVFFEALRDFGAGEYNLSYTFVVEEYMPNVTEEEWDLDSFMAEAEEPVPIKFSSSYINEGGSETPRTEVYICNFSGDELIYVVPSTTTTIIAEDAGVMGLNIPNELTTLDVYGEFSMPVITLPEGIDMDELPAGDIMVNEDEGYWEYWAGYYTGRLVVLGGGYFEVPDAMCIGKLFVPEENTNFEVENGILYNAEKTQLIKLLQFAKGEITLPETLEEILPGAFLDLTWENFPSYHTPVSLVLNNKFETIPESMFADCLLLGGITIPESVNSIGAYAFANCENLTTVNLTNGLQEIGEYAFENSGITSIEVPSTVNSMEYAFSGCSNLTVVYLSDGIETISDYAFYNSGLESVNIPASVKEIGEYAFSMDSTGYGLQFSNLAEVNFSEGLEIIGDYAFYGNKIQSLTIPSTVKSIGDRAFSMHSLAGATGGAIPTVLTNVNLPEGLETIGQYAFSYTGITSIRIPSTVNSMDYAFYGCRYLENITLPEGLKSIGQYAFYDAGITSITIPSTVKVVGSYAVTGCNSLVNITISNGVERIEASAIRGAGSGVYLSIPPSITFMDFMAISSGPAPSVIEFTGRLDEYNDFLSIFSRIVNTANYAGVSKIYVPADEGDDFRELLATYTANGISPSMGTTLASKVEER